MSELTVQKPSQFDLSPQTFEQALTFAKYLADSELVPKDFKGKPGNCLVAIQWGMEIGLKPMQALQNIAVINGRPALWGDSVLALVRGSPLCEYVVETTNGNTAVCRVKRRGEEEQIRTFSDDDARAAGLLGKQGPWSQYKPRMRQMRARAFALRDVFPDVLKGLPVAEEVMDMPAQPRDMGAAVEVEQASAELLTAARTAADAGRDAFAAWWKAAAPEDRKLLKGELSDLQARTQRAAEATAAIENAVPAAAEPDEFLDAYEREEVASEVRGS